MLHRIAVSPQGSIGLIATVSETTSPVPASEAVPEIIAAFDVSLAHGLVTLASSCWQSAVADWPAEFGFWRNFARQYFNSLCRHSRPTSKQWFPVAPPDKTTLGDWRQFAPPLPGWEHLQPEHLQRVWHELDEYANAAAKRHPEGLAGFLESLDPTWNLIGRVTFHLAENRKNPDAPFAFMATFTSGRTKAGTPQHLPLAEALRESIAAKDTAKLDQLLEPVSRAAKSVKLVDRLLESRRLFTPQAWGIGEAYEFLAAIPLMEQAGLVIRVPNWWNAARPPRPQVSVRIGCKEPSRFGVAGLDLQVGVRIDGEPLSEPELKQLLASRESLVFLKGKWVELNREQLSSALKHWREVSKRQVDGVDFLQAMRMLSGAAIGDTPQEESSTRWARIEPGEWLQQTLRSLREPTEDAELDPESVVKAQLRPYQTAGVHWLWFATQLGLGVCLADDMGLGKTLQVISLIALMRKRQPASGKRASPCLIVVPASLLGNWQRELAKFAPHLNLLVAHRSVASLTEFEAIEAAPEQGVANKDVVIVTYGAIRKAKWLSQIKWELIVLDEAQAIKNAASIQAKALKAIPARSRIVMTGTPIENQLGDLWSLFDFSSPGLLGTAAEFKRFVSSKDERQRALNLAALRKLVQPYVLRRMKTDPQIVPDLPRKTEMRVDCNLSAVQAALYGQVVEELKASLEQVSGIQRRGRVLATLMQLKQICNHPGLYLKNQQFEPGNSGKYQELQRLCEEIAAKQEKVLVFSQFQSMCDPLSQFLSEIFGRPGLVLTGETSVKSRAKLVSDFQQPFGPPFFVISVKAGGTGLNLTEACHVVHFDRWWNPAVEDQATDRAFRIGQVRNVLVHKFVTTGTLEERIDDLIASKKHLGRELLDGSGEVNLTEMSNDQLLHFVSLDLHKANSI